MDDIEKGQLALKAEKYINLIISEMRENALNDISLNNPNLENIRIHICACNLIKSIVKRDIMRGTDAKNVKESING